LIENTTKRKTWLYWIHRALYWVIPVIILYVIFQRIDIGEFKSNISKTEPWLVVLGIAYYPAVILIGAWRWRLLISYYNKSYVKLNYVLKHYWIGLALGFFTPASLGWDGYRIVVTGRYFKQYALNTAVILAEKLMALLTCMSMIIFLYPITTITSSPEIDRILYVAYILFFISIIFFLAINFTVRNSLLSALLKKMEVYFSGALLKTVSKLGFGSVATERKIPFRAMIQPLTLPRQLFPILILSFGIQLVAAIGNQIFFLAIGYDLPFIANLFITPILFFVFILPISFGSLGIREGAYIILYGLFGVPAETALLVSFFNLSGLLLNNLVGGSLMLFSNVKWKTLPKIDIEG